jgi:hypothetical protein
VVFFFCNFLRGSNRWTSLGGSNNVSDHSNGESDGKMWSNQWKIKVPSKIQNSMWRLAAADLASLLPGQLPGLPAADAVYFYE